jgi:hypothetical protein
MRCLLGVLSCSELGEPLEGGVSVEAVLIESWEYNDSFDSLRLEGMEVACGLFVLFGKRRSGKEALFVFFLKVGIAGCGVQASTKPLNFTFAEGCRRLDSCGFVDLRTKRQMAITASRPVAAKKIAMTAAVRTGPVSSSLEPDSVST